MAKSVAVLQSNYLPWKGNFDLIHDVDLFIFYDDIQYSKNSWRNRNQIKTRQGREWLTVPVGSDENRLICEVVIDDQHWPRRHWRSIQQNYSKAPHFDRYAPFLEDVFQQRWRNLSELNQFLIRSIATDFLGIKTEFQDSRQYQLHGKKLERLIDLVGQAGATTYLSGPAGRDYIVPHAFREVGVELAWKDYVGYPVYTQFFPPFLHEVTILDVLFQVGPEAPQYIWGWRNQQPAATAL